MADTENKLQARPGESVPATNWLNPFFDLRRRMESLFDDMLTGGAMMTAPGGEAWPAAFAGDGGADVRFEVREGERDIEITAELPGLSPEEVAVEHANGVLTVSGEKTVEHTRTDKDVRLSERRYGAFRRAFRLPDGADADKTEAKFRDGVLTITVPKAPESASKTNRITITRA
jgi:HSP20 family protein